MTRNNGSDHALANPNVANGLYSGVSGVPTASTTRFR